MEERSYSEAAITAAANFAGHKLGYEDGLKEMQVKIITEFVTGKARNIKVIASV